MMISEFNWLENLPEFGLTIGIVELIEEHKSNQRALDRAIGRMLEIEAEIEKTVARFWSEAEIDAAKRDANFAPQLEALEPRRKKEVS